MHSTFTRLLFLASLLFCSLAGATGIPGISSLGATALSDVWSLRYDPVQTIPTDPAVRYAGFTPRVGTWLPTDNINYWNFSTASRAEVQDAYYTIAQPCLDTPLVWNGNVATLTPGTTNQAYRDATYRMLNLQRYFYFGSDPAQCRYVVENPAALIYAQSAAMVMSANNKLSHTIDSSWIGYSANAATGASYSDLCLYISGPDAILGYFSDTGDNNVNVAHRFGLLKMDITHVASGDIANVQGASSGANALWSNLNDPSHPLADSVILSGDPFDYAHCWPYKGYFPRPWLARIAADNNELRVSIDFGRGFCDLVINGVSTADRYTLIDPSSFTVTRDGIPLAVTAAHAAGSDGNHTTLVLSVQVGDQSQVTTDQVYTVTVKQVAFLPETVGFTEVSNLPTVALSPRDFSYSFTLFSPETVVTVPSGASSAIVGISGRSTIGTGDNVSIAGFAITGNEPLRVAVRSQGPGLASQGVGSPAGATTIELYKLNSDGSHVDLGSNAAWKSGANWRLLQSVSMNPSATNEGALVATLPPGNYTAVVSDPTARGGIGMAEIYAIDPVSKSQLTGISLRSLVGTEESSLIAGFIVSSPMTVMVRTQGPSLTALGVAGAVTGTSLKLYRLPDRTLIATNTGWRNPGYLNARFTTDLAAQAPGSAQEAAIVIRLEPGVYTALVYASDGRTGVGMAEVYRVSD